MHVSLFYCYTSGPRQNARRCAPPQRRAAQGMRAVHVKRTTTADALRAQSGGQAATARRFGPLTVTHPVSNTQTILLRRLGLALECEPHRAAVVDAIKGHDGISLRMLDWLVTNFAKQRALRIWHESDGVDVHDEYRMALSVYRRRNFDPFCRGTMRGVDGATKDFTICVAHAGESYRTSIGQVNFMDWAVSRGVIAYAQTHSDTVVRDMNRAAAQARQARKRSSTRLTLSQPPASKCRVFNGVRTMAVS